jgi:hypothetical protein
MRELVHTIVQNGARLLRRSDCLPVAPRAESLRLVKPDRRSFLTRIAGMRGRTQLEIMLHAQAPSISNTNETVSGIKTPLLRSFLVYQFSRG